MNGVREADADRHWIHAVGVLGVGDRRIVEVDAWEPGREARLVIAFSTSVRHTEWADSLQCQIVNREGGPVLLEVLKSKYEIANEQKQPGVPVVKMDAVYVAEQSAFESCRRRSAKARKSSCVAGKRTIGRIVNIDARLPGIRVDGFEKRMVKDELPDLEMWPLAWNLEQLSCLFLPAKRKRERAKRGGRVLVQKAGRRHDDRDAAFKLWQ